MLLDGVHLVSSNRTPTDKMREVNVKPARKPKSRLKPVKVDSKKKIIPKWDSRKPRWWRVDIGKKITGTSKQTRFFSSEAEANEFIRSIENEFRIVGIDEVFF